MDYSAIFGQAVGVAQSGAFGGKVSNLANRFAGNPPPASSQPIQIQTSPQTVNPAANPTAAETRTWLPSSAFFKTASGGLNVPMLVGAAVAVLAVVYLVARRK